MPQVDESPQPIARRFGRVVVAAGPLQAGPLGRRVDQPDGGHARPQQRQVVRAANRNEHRVLVRDRGAATGPADGAETAG
jgi:hypothetical protein